MMQPPLGTMLLPQLSLPHVVPWNTRSLPAMRPKWHVCCYIHNMICTQHCFGCHPAALYFQCDEDSVTSSHRTQIPTSSRNISYIRLESLEPNIAIRCVFFLVSLFHWVEYNVNRWNCNSAEKSAWLIIISTSTTFLECWCCFVGPVIRHPDKKHVDSNVWAVINVKTFSARIFHSS